VFFKETKHEDKIKKNPFLAPDLRLRVSRGTHLSQWQVEWDIILLPYLSFQDILKNLFNNRH
jgi:hypothetical protein